MWTGKQLLASGANGTIFLITSGDYAHCVLKTSWLHSIESEANILSRLKHSNIVRFLALLDEIERDEEGFQKGSMVLEKLGPSLASLLASRQVLQRMKGE